MTAVLAAEAERMMRTAHRQHRSTCRESLVEDIDLAVRIAAELEREQRQQYRFAGTSRPYHHHMPDVADMRSEEHTSELQSLMRISYAVFCLKKKNTHKNTQKQTN